MPGSEGLLLKWSKSSYKKQILSDLHYGKVLDFYVLTTLIKYLLRRIRSRKGIRNNRNFLYVPQQSLYLTKSYIIRDLFLRVSWWISCSLILESKRFPSLQWLDSSLHPVKQDCFPSQHILPQNDNSFEKLGIWLSSTGFLFHSGHWIGGPGVIGGKFPNRFST